MGITSLMRDSTYVDLENGNEPNVLLSHAQRHSGAGLGDSKMSDTWTFVSSRSRVESSYPADEAMPYEPPASSKLDNESWSKRTWGDHEITWGGGSESSSIERIKTLEGEVERSWSMKSGNAYTGGNVAGTREKSYKTKVCG